MTELSLRGLEEDESALVLEDATGSAYRLPIDDALVVAVRGAHRRQASTVRSDEPLRPRDIQAMIRQGMTAQEIAQETGEDLEHIRVYEGPVLAERGHIAHQAGRVLVRPETDAAAPTPLADLALERLKLREVDPETLSWDAWRRADGTWQVELSFEAGSRLRTASWSYSRGSVHALDDEARWLSDAGPTDSGPIPGYGTGEERKARAAEPAPAAPARDHQTETGRILESLRRRRGVTASQHTGEIPLPGRGGPDEAAPHGRRRQTGHLTAHDGEAAPHGADSGPAADAGPTPGGGGLRLVGDDRDQSIDGAHSAPSAPGEALDAEIVAVPAPHGARTPGQRHPDQHTAPIGTPDFDDPEYAGTLPPAPVPGSGDTAPHGGDAVEAGPGPDHPSLLEVDEVEPAAEPDPADAGDAHDPASLFPAPGGEETPSPRPAPESGGRRRGRASVPSWDEIMFGGRGKD
ncbi:septation protein SepH [Brevibacterium salitolerans]|uniref:Septation protein SepH n=1 Tax=Brevibacterium salitolerans TaxID=1403566 RepID=A0ABN2X9D5_9MICO